jgi:signal transduction histidine kinase/CheY-like chemotaxis protein
VSIFTGLLVSWVVVVSLAIYQDQTFLGMGKPLAIGCAVLLVAAGIAKFTSRLLVKPLAVLEQGIRNLEAGKLTSITPARTGDEIEYLGESFNRMVAALAAYRQAVVRSQELLEERIGERTEELERALSATVSASRAKSEFLANMSHELRTPMSGVIGMLGLLSETPMTREQRDYLNTAKNSANSLLALVNDLLDLSKIEADRMVLEEIPFELRTLARECLRGSLAAAAAKRLTLDLEVDPDTPKGIAGDPLRLRQVLVNLISNAVKFTTSGGVSVRIWYEAGVGADCEYTLRIAVSDTGSGIPSDKLDAIFEKFTQADTSISRRYGGSGLGLAITKKLVELQRGRIRVESVLGEGSCFYVDLPCRPASLLAGADPELGECNGGLGGAPSGRGLILLVEDNAVNQKVVKAILRKRGFEVDIAGDGMRAIEALEERPYALILMDVQMPVLDGLETTLRIRADARYESLPIVAMTAHAMSGDRERCLAAGMNAYLAKPVDPRHLTRVIDELTARPPAETPAAAATADPERISKLTEADPAIASQMVKLFLQLAPERLDRLRASTEYRDCETLRRDARRLLGAAQSIAAIGVMKSAEEVHKAGLTADWDRAAKSLTALELEVRRLSLAAAEQPRQT